MHDRGPKTGSTTVDVYAHMYKKHRQAWHARSAEGWLQRLYLWMMRDSQQLIRIETSAHKCQLTVKHESRIMIDCYSCVGHAGARRKVIAVSEQPSSPPPPP